MTDPSCDHWIIGAMIFVLFFFDFFVLAIIPYYSEHHPNLFGLAISIIIIPIMMMMMIIITITIYYYCYYYYDC